MTYTTPAIFDISTMEKPRDFTRNTGSQLNTK